MFVPDTAPTFLVIKKKIIKQDSVSALALYIK